MDPSARNARARRKAHKEAVRRKVAKRLAEPLPVEVVLVPEKLQETLQRLVDGYQTVGMPALIERLILKHGTLFEGKKWVPIRGVRRMAPKQCFRNATYGVWDHGFEYWEGYAMGRDIQFPFLHAWNVHEGRVIDLTLREPEKYVYMGMQFTDKQIVREQMKHEVFGMLDIGIVNIDFLRELDNNLVEEALNVRRNRAA